MTKRIPSEKQINIYLLMINKMSLVRCLLSDFQVNSLVYWTSGN